MATVNIDRDVPETVLVNMNRDIKDEVEWSCDEKSRGEKRYEVRDTSYNIA